MRPSLTAVTVAACLLTIFTPHLSSAEKLQGLSGRQANVANKDSLGGPLFLSARSTSANDVRLTWSGVPEHAEGIILQRAVVRWRLLWVSVATLGRGATNYDDTTVSANTTYFYRLIIQQNYNYPRESNPALVTTLPLPPVSLSATAVGASEIDLAWTPDPSGEYGFLVERAPDNAGSPGKWSPLARLWRPFTRYKDTHLSAGATFWYRVRAFNFSGFSVPTTEVSATTPTPPAAPSALTSMEVAPHQVALVWADNSTNENGFKIDRAEDMQGLPGAWSPLSSVAANITSFLDTNAAACTTYWYRVRAFNVAGDSPNTDPTAAVVGPPPGPAGLTAIASDVDRIDLAWTENSTLQDGFLVERAPDAGGNPGTWTVVGSSAATTTTFSDSGLTSGQVYWYQVLATNDCGPSDPSAPVSILFSPPAAPAGLTANVLWPTEIQLSWSNMASNADGVAVERSTDGTRFVQIAQLSPSVSGYLNTGLFPGVTYYYRIRSFRSPGGSARSNIAGIATPPTACPLSTIGWGENDYGQSNPNGNASGFVALSCGYLHTIALASDGTVTGWGDTYTATPPQGLIGVTAISAGLFHNLVLENDGTVIGWGDNYYGEATPPPGLSNVVAVAAGYFHGLALINDGTIVGWGDDSYGQSTPPAGLSNVVAVAGGYFHSLALTSDGTVVGWGDNSYSQSSPPTGLTGVIAIAAGGYHSLALKSDGTVVGWGGNFFGEASPPAALNGVVAIAAGLLHSVALKSDGTVVSWGYNVDGEAPTPATVSNAIVISAGVYDSAALTPAPATPGLLSAIPLAGNLIGLNWQDNSAGTGATELQRAPDAVGKPGPWSTIVTIAPGTTNYSDATVLSNTIYWYRARTSNNCQSSPYNAPVVTQTATPAAPSQVSTTVYSEYEVNVSWLDNSFNESGFRIERANDAGGSPGTWTVLATTGPNTTSFLDGSVTSGTTYWYRVFATNAIGDSLPSSAVRTRVGPPDAPTNLNATAVAVNEVDLSWSADFQDSSGFAIERAPDMGGTPGSWNEIAFLAAGSSTFADRNVAAGSTNWYRIQAYNAIGYSPYSDPVEAVIEASLPRIILDDTWEDGLRNVQQLPSETAWWTSSANGAPLSATNGMMTLRLTGGSAMILSYFTPSANSPPIWLNVGDTLTATLSFVFDGIPAVGSTSQGFRIGLFDFADSSLNPKRVTSDGSFSSTSQGNGVQGYALFQKMYGAFADNLPMDIRKRTVLNDTSLLGSSGDWLSLIKGGDNNGIYGFLNQTPYDLQFVLQRIGINSMNITISWTNRADGTTLSLSFVDTNATNFSFDGIAYRPQSTSQAPATNEFTEVKIEVSSVPIPAYIIGQPQDDSLSSGQTASFGVVANGTLPIYYQWFLNTNTPLLNATNALLTLTNSQLSDVGFYSVVVSNAYGSVTSSVAALNVTNIAPIIGQQPQDVTVIPGLDATFQVVASGSEPLTYQWFFDTNTPLLGATSPVLTLANVQPSDAGTYSVLVTSPAGSTTSSTANLVVNTNPVVPIFITQPFSLEVWEGDTATFSAMALANSTIDYQWYKDGVPVPGGTGTNLTLPSAQATNAGAYALVASDELGSSASSSATLVVKTRIPALPLIPTNEYNILTYGAVGDAATDNTLSIQSAINVAAGAGGGTVVVSAAGQNTVYLCGPVSLANNVNLRIDAGAVLQMLPMSLWPSASIPFINGSGLHDVAITGSGTIDGQGSDWWFPKAPARPNFINFTACTRVLIQGLQLQNPPTFHLMLKGNNVDVTIQNLTINTPGNSPNTDGMDLASSNVLVRSCSISDGDDNIEIGGSGGPAAVVTVVDCAFGTGHGVSIGSITSGGVYDLIVSNCTFNGTDYGIRMKSDNDRGGTVERLRYSDITMTNVGFPLVIYSYYNSVGTPNYITPVAAAYYYTAQPFYDTTPVWSDIVISNVNSTASRGGIITGILWGRPESPISNVTLANVNIADPAKNFDIYNAQNVNIINSQLITPGGTNDLDLYNAQITVTNTPP